MRRGRWFIEADSDKVLAPLVASAFSNVGLSLVFTVEDGQLRFYEETGRKWSDVVARKAKQTK